MLYKHGEWVNMVITKIPMYSLFPQRMKIVTYGWTYTRIIIEYQRLYTLFGYVIYRKWIRIVDENGRAVINNRVHGLDYSEMDRENYYKVDEVTRRLQTIIYSFTKKYNSINTLPIQSNVSNMI